MNYALVTPSFRLDLDRCEMLIESVERWVAPHVTHYLVVDRRDLPLFRPFRRSRTEILIVEDIIPRWLFRIPGIRRFWMSTRTLPVRNWMLQQIVKLSVPAVLAEDILLYVDSDVFFVAPYDPRTFERDGAVPLFVEHGQRGLLPQSELWHATAARLLGLTAEDGYDTNFIGNVVCWRRENVIAMHSRVQEVARRCWQQALAGLDAFSEYVLYGMYATRVLGDTSGHWQDGLIRTLNYWTPSPLDLKGLQELCAQRAPHHHSVMISAKSRTPVSDIRKVFG